MSKKTADALEVIPAFGFSFDDGSAPGFDDLSRDADDRRRTLANHVHHALRGLAREGPVSGDVRVQLALPPGGDLPPQAFTESALRTLVVSGDLCSRSDLSNGGILELVWMPRPEEPSPSSLTSIPDSWDGGGEGRGSMGDDEPPQAEEMQLRDAFAEASLADLVKALVPAVPEAAINRLKAVLQEAQGSPPEDKEAFVRDVNRILDARNLRLEIEGEEHLARLSIKNGSLAFAAAGGRGTVGFRRSFTVVEVSETYAHRGAQKRTKPSGPEA